MKRFKQKLAGLAMALGLFAALTCAGEVVSSAAGGWFAVDARDIKDTTWEGGVIVVGETNLVLQCSPNAWGAADGGSGVTVAYSNTTTGDAGTIAENTTAETVVWTPNTYGTFVLTHTVATGGDPVVLTATFAVPGVTFMPTAIDNATAVVYKNGAEMAQTGDAYLIASNAAATVVYTAEDGYAFADGTTAKTNTIDTSVNPATADVPAAPLKLIKYVAPVYKGTDNNPTNGISHWVTNNVPSGYTIVASVEDYVEWGEYDKDRWYVVTNGTFQFDYSVCCAGRIHLVLCKGAKLTASCGIDISSDTAEITIYGQPDGAGTLEATGGDGAAIGGVEGASGPITINGGTVTATGGRWASGIGGGGWGAGTNITINGGTVTATGSMYGSGIGGGNNGAGTGITINGGTVTATGEFEGSGIGGGNNGAGTGITINGGEVTATGGACGSGIGGGGYAAGTGITINGGTVKATGGNDPDCIDGAGAGIGGGGVGAGTDITINGGEVTALGGDAYDDNVNCGAAGIGGGEYGIGTNITINGGTVFVANQAPRADLIGSGSDAGEAASDVTIAAAANVMFDLVGASGGLIEAALPEWEGCWIMTPDPAVERTLVTGCADWTAKTTFTLRKPEQERTKEIAINGESVPFANAMLTLTNDVTASVLKLTADDLPDETTVTGASGDEVKIVAEDDRLEELGIQKEDMVDTKNVQTNGLLTWQSYVLGLDPTNRLSGIYADAPQNANAGAVTIETREFTSSEIAPGFGLQYRLEKQEAGFTPKTQNTASFDLDLTGDDPTGHYKLSVVITSNDVQLADTAEAINTVGLVKAANTNRYGVIAVPWGALAPGEERDIAVSNVIKTAGLEEGDKLHVYRPDKSVYDTWTLNDKKEWGSVTTYKINKDGTVSSETSGDAAETTIARGNGVWLERVNPTSAPYFLYGQANAEVTPTVEKGYNLLSAPGIEPWNLSHVTGATDRDQILIPGAEPKLFTFKDGKWGYYKTTTTEILVGKNKEKKTAVKSVWTTDESTIPAGTGFWLINASGNVVIE